MSLRIAVVKGDGIGPEVIPEAQKILEHFLADADFFEVELGFAKWEKTGSACSAEDIRELKRADAILFGAVTTPPDPDYRSVLLQIRHELDLYANFRPIRALQSYAQGSPVDMMIVRENTEGLYSGIEEIGEERSTTLRVVTKAGFQTNCRESLLSCLGTKSGSSARYRLQRERAQIGYAFQGYL